MMIVWMLASVVWMCGGLACLVGGDMHMAVSCMVMSWVLGISVDIKLMEGRILEAIEKQ